ncbi:MAG: DUF4263 domain-containing protein [bacterium]|nr:DUF4263 domain-containing protein [bacterium]
MENIQPKEIGGMKLVEASAPDYVAGKLPGKIYASDFRGQSGKYFSVVADQPEGGSRVLYEGARLQIRAAYIAQRGQVVELKIERYEKKKGVLDPNSKVEIRIDTKNLVVLRDFIDFLQKTNLSAVAAGRLSFDANLKLDPDLQAKLVALAQDEAGKEILLKLFQDGYLTAGLDLPDLIKKGLIRTKIEEKFSVITEFEKLINTSGANELVIQEFLTSAPWIFGPEYISADIRGAGSSGIPDRRLKRIDGLSDILEIKLPTAEVLRTDKMGRQYIADDTAKALGQLMAYLEFYTSEYRQEKDDKSGEEILPDTYGRYYKPKGILLIGRRSVASGVDGVKTTSDVHPKYLRRIMSYFHGIEVLTYDDLIERARNGLEAISGGDK